MLLKHDVFVRLCRSRQLLRDVGDRPLSVKDVAREAGMSPFHFIRRFESLFGWTPHQFRIRSRIERAKILLACGTQSVTEVCLELGMDSLGSFSDMFTRRVGATPSAYQRSAHIETRAPGSLPEELFPGCLSLMSRLPQSAFRNFQEAYDANAPLQSGGGIPGGKNENKANQHYGG
jgi:AraC-like DNA-binding protein